MIRIVGIVGIVALTIFSLVLFDQTVRPPAQASPEVVGDSLVPTSTTSVDIPDFLGFEPGWESGEYRVSDPVDKKVKRLDRDVKQRKSDVAKSGRTPLDSLPEIAPGRYTTRFGVEECSYVLSAVHRDRKERDIGSDALDQGRLIVTIEEIEPDRFTADENCGDWSEWVPLEEDLTAAPNGDYWKGDLTPGIWQVPKGCLWEKVLAFRGSRLSDVEESGRGPVPLVIDEKTRGVRIRGCSEPVTFTSSS